ncbi:MAG: nickel-dependent lactate racemase [Bacteroidota bacterium]
MVLYNRAKGKALYVSRRTSIIPPPRIIKKTSAMQIHLAYGKSGLDVDIPDRNLLKVLEMEEARSLGDPAGVLARALQEPLGGPPLASIAQQARSACVVICDITRPVPNTVLLPPLLKTLEEGGIDREQITILIATGLHRESTSDEVMTMIGGAIKDRYAVRSHRARVLEEQTYLGETPNGSPVYIDKAYCSADLKITTGFIEPHLMAGFSGGRKLIAPGCAGEETIKALHSPKFIEHPECREGSIDQNPLHRELLEIARMAGHDFLVNVTLDTRHAITGMFAGDPLVAHTAGIQHARQSVRATIPRKADIVVTTSAGYPLDLTLYQAVKGMTAALPIVKGGGMLLLVAECAEGLGSHEFSEMATSFPSADAFVDFISRNPVVIDQWQLEECAKAARHAEVVLVSPVLSRRHGSDLFVKTAETVEGALQAGWERLGPDASVAVIPKGPYTLVEVDPTSG